jgi:hypothetical protein
MDTYLPADFREIHDAAPDDWRDASSSCIARDRTATQGTRDDGVTDPTSCADPFWRVL